jgi:hypothetical protein
MGLMPVVVVEQDQVTREALAAADLVRQTQVTAPGDDDPAFPIWL